MLVSVIDIAKVLKSADMPVCPKKWHKKKSAVLSDYTLCQYITL